MAKKRSIIKNALELLRGPLFSSAGIYMLVGFVGPLLAFLFMPIFTRVLSPEDYGMGSMFGVLCGVLASFVGINTHGAVARKYIDRESVDFPEYLSNCLFIVLISSGVVFFVMWVLQAPLSKYTKFPEHWMWVAVLFASGQHIIRLTQTLFQMQQRPWRFAVISISSVLLPILFSLYLVIGLDMDWRGRVISRVLTTSFLSIATLIFLWKAKFIRWKLNSEYLRHALKFGIPLIPHALGVYFISMTDRLLIVNMVGLEDLGIYSVGAQIGMVIGICQSGFHQAWMPVFYKKLKQNLDSVNRKIVKFIYLYDVVLLAVALIGGFLSIPVLKVVLGERFSSAGIYVVWIMVGYAFNGMYKMVSGFIFYAEKTKYLAFITGGTAVLNLIFSYCLIARNGSIGAAQGTMIAYFISFVLSAIFARFVYKMPWSLRKSSHETF